MRSAFISTIVAGSLLISATSAAARQPELAPSRTGADIENADELRGAFMIVGLIAVLLVIGVFVVFDDDDEPTSP